MSNSNPNYFRLGLFVFGGLAALVAVILIFGSGQLFKKSFMVETYLKQSVTGLDTGAAVRFRGVKVGQVTLIGLSGDIYEKDRPFEKRLQYVVVRMQIFGDKLTEEQIEDFVKNNLRARVKSMGITGVNYVEFDFSDGTSDYEPLPYDWQPVEPVIPSLPNQADEIIMGLQKFVTALNNANIDQLLVSLNTLLAGDGKGNEGLARSVQSMNVILERIAKATDKEELNILMRELIGTIVSLRQTVTTIQGDTATTVENLKQTTENLNEFSRIASQSPSSLIWGEPPPRIVPPLNGTQGQSGAQK